MTVKQRQARAKFKAAIKEAGKLRKKNPKLTQAQAVKQAWAILYSKERKGEKIGYSKEREKLHKNATAWLKKRKNVDEDKTKKERVSIAYQRAPFGRPGVGAIKKKSATKVKAKKGKSTEMHTDTKSHNVNIRVISGIEGNMYKIRDQYEQDIKRYLYTIDGIKKVSKTTLTKAEKIRVAKSLKAYKLLLMKTKKQLNEQNKLINQALK
jgi:hypothetical protein